MYIILALMISYAGKGTPVVLLLFDAGPLNVTWADDNVDVVAIMECFFPAQSTGDALAKVLMPNGTSPAGRLPSTWPALASQVRTICSCIFQYNE